MLPFAISAEVDTDLFAAYARFWSGEMKGTVLGLRETSRVK